MSRPGEAEEGPPTLLYLLVLGFLGSSLLGSVIEAALAPFLWLIIARPFVGLALSLLPPLKMGRVRPWVLGSAGLAAVATLLFPIEGPQCYLAVLLVYLVTDICLDGFYVQYYAEPQWVSSGAVLIISRTLGVVFGLLLDSLVVFAPHWQSRSVQTQLALLLLFVLVFREKPGETFLSLKTRPRPEGRNWFKPALSNAVEWRTLTAWGRLLSVTALLGLVGGETLPYVVLSLPRVLGWAEAPLEWLAVLMLGSCLACVVSGLALKRLLIGSLSVFLSAVLACSLPVPSSGALLGMQVSGIVAALVCLRACLSSAHRIPPPLRGALFSVSWVVSTLAFVWCLNNLEPNYALVLKGFLIGLVGFFVVVAIRQPEPTPEMLNPFEDADRERRRRGEGLHGDKTLDFTAVPESPSRRKGRRSFSYFFYTLTVRFPITLILIILTSGVLAMTWELVDSKEALKKRGEDTWKRIRTEFFLTSLAHRISEEMLASSRVPKDWTKFVETNFANIDGRQISDVDFWGTPLEFQVTPDDVSVTSAGVDREFQTEDDITRTVSRPQGVKD